MRKSLHIIYGIIIFILLVLSIIGYSYCGSYKNKYQKLSDTLKERNNENVQLVERVRALEQDLESTKSQLQAKNNEADMLNTALSDLRKRVIGR